MLKYQFPTKKELRESDFYVFEIFHQIGEISPVKADLDFQKFC